MANAILVSTTFESKEEAEKMASYLLEERLIACAQITGPITSCYWWKNDVENSIEYGLAMKSMEELYVPLERSIKEMHPYETPEIIAVPIIHIDKEYLEWMKMELQN